jgi:hypothetical protein
MRYLRPTRRDAPTRPTTETTRRLTAGAAAALGALAGAVAGSLAIAVGAAATLAVAPAHPLALVGLTAAVVVAPFALPLAAVRGATRALAAVE